MNPLIKKAVICSSFLCLILQVAGIGFSQPTKPDGVPEIRLGEITFQMREFGSPPSRFRMLEIHITILNKSRTSETPPHSIKVVAIPREITFPEGAPGSGFDPGSGEITLNSPLPPNSGRVVILGFSLLEAKPKSITFEIQMNPPNGEKKTVKWEAN